MKVISVEVNWLSQPVNRRDLIIKDGTRFKNGLHEQISLAYPTPVHLQGKMPEELTEELREISKIFRQSKAEFILECIRSDGNTARDFQDSRDFITRSLMHDLEHQKETLFQLDKEIEKVLLSFDYKLTSMPGIGIAGGQQVNC